MNVNGASCAEPKIEQTDKQNCSVKQLLALHDELTALFHTQWILRQLQLLLNEERCTEKVDTWPCLTFTHLAANQVRTKHPLPQFVLQLRGRAESGLFPIQGPHIYSSLQLLTIYRIFTGV